MSLGLKFVKSTSVLGRPRLHGDLRPIQAYHPLQFAALNVLGPFLDGEHGNKYISRWWICIAGT